MPVPGYHIMSLASLLLSLLSCNYFRLFFGDSPLCPGKGKQWPFRAHDSEPDCIRSPREALGRVLPASLHPDFLPVIGVTGPMASSAIFTPTLFDDDKSRCVLSDWPTSSPLPLPLHCIIMFIFGSCVRVTCPSSCTLRCLGSSGTCYSAVACNRPLITPLSALDATPGIQHA